MSLFVQVSCIVVAALLHYLFLSVFCWMLCEGIMLYLMLVLVFSKLSKKWWMFLIIGYGELSVVSPELLYVMVTCFYRPSSDSTYSNAGSTVL